MKTTARKRLTAGADALFLSNVLESDLGKNVKATDVLTRLRRERFAT